MTISWPDLIFEDLQPTLTTVHLWTQIVGKIRLRKTPWINHSWHVTLFISPKGLTTGNIPYDNGVFNLEFDFVKEKLLITSSGNGERYVDLYPRSVASFYKELFSKLKLMHIHAEIYGTPNEIENPIPFEKDEVHFHYEKEQILLFWQALVKIETIFLKFRSRYQGKCSPVHFFWGAFDLAVTRFSGREAPKHPGGAPNIPLDIMQEAYSHEVSSCGFWAGNEAYPHPVFYAYCYPTPAHFKEQPVRPAKAFYSSEMGEFLLNYDEVRNATDPESYLMDFLQSTYEAAAKTGNWDRPNLERNLSK